MRLSAFHFLHRVRVGVLALLAASCARSTAGQRAPSRLSAAAITDAGYHNETSLAIDPSDGRRMVAAWQIPATVGWSADGGATWDAAPLPAVGEWQLSGDPVVGFDGDGHAYALYIAFDRPADYDTLGRAARRNGIWLARSDDGGRSWTRAPAAVVSQAEAPGIPFEDKPALGIDRGADPARRGTLYVAWTEFRRHDSTILFARSTDGGRSFSPAIEIADRTGSPKDSTGAAEGTSIAVAPDGTVYVVWSDSSGILLDRSTDGGRTFGRDQLIARTPDIVFGIPGVARANGYPSLGIDPRDGRLFVVWVDGRRGAAEPWLSTSGDGGGRWSMPAPVAGARADGAARFFAALAVDPRTGLVAVSYYRVTMAPRIDYVLALSRDGGRSFAERGWGRPAFDPHGEFLGDYTGIDALDGRVAAAWTEIERPDSSGGAGGVRGTHHARVVVGRGR